MGAGGDGRARLRQPLWTAITRRSMSARGLGYFTCELSRCRMGNVKTTEAGGPAAVFDCGEESQTGRKRHVNPRTQSACLLGAEVCIPRRQARSRTVAPARPSPPFHDLLSVAASTSSPTAGLGRRQVWLNTLAKISPTGTIEIVPRISPYCGVFEVIPRRWVVETQPAPWLKA